MQLVFATNNINKLREVQSLIPNHIKLLSLEEVGCLEDVPETQETIEGNAIQKATYIKEKYGYAYTCSIGTYTRMKLKTCIKDFGKVKGLSFDMTNKLTKDIDDQIEYTW